MATNDAESRSYSGNPHYINTLTALRAENQRLRAIVATLADLHNDGNPAKVIELCKQYKVDIPYWLGGGVVEVEALRRVAHELIYYSDTLTKGDGDGT